MYYLVHLSLQKPLKKPLRFSFTVQRFVDTGAFLTYIALHHKCRKFCLRFSVQRITQPRIDCGVAFLSCIEMRQCPGAETYRGRKSLSGSEPEPLQPAVGPTRAPSPCNTSLFCQLTAQNHNSNSSTCTLVSVKKDNVIVQEILVLKVNSLSLIWKPYSELFCSNFVSLCPIISSNHGRLYPNQFFLEKKCLIFSNWNKEEQVNFCGAILKILEPRLREAWSKTLAKSGETCLTYRRFFRICFPGKWLTVGQFSRDALLSPPPPHAGGQVSGWGCHCQCYALGGDQKRGETPEKPNRQTTNLDLCRWLFFQLLPFASVHSCFVFVIQQNQISSFSHRLVAGNFLWNLVFSNPRVFSPHVVPKAP